LKGGCDEDFSCFINGEPSMIVPKEKTCNNCIYEDQKTQFKKNGYIQWASSKEFPCLTCLRAGILQMDNYMEDT